MELFLNCLHCALHHAKFLSLRRNLSHLWYFGTTKTVSNRQYRHREQRLYQYFPIYPSILWDTCRYHLLIPHLLQTKQQFLYEMIITREGNSLLLQAPDCSHIGIYTIPIVNAASSIQTIVFDHWSCWTFVLVPSSWMRLLVKMTIKENSFLFDFSLNLN